MIVRVRNLVAAVGLCATHALPGMAAGEPVPASEPAPLVIDASRPPAPDLALAHAVADRLRQSGQLQDYRVDIEVNGAVAHLGGSVASEPQRQAALRLASETPGITSVVDRLAIGGPSIRQVQAEQIVPPREPAQLLPRAPTPSNPAPPAGGPVEPVPLMAGQGASPYDLYTPQMPPYAWPTYAPYNNYSRVAYPLAYPHEAWPNIGPCYPFPKVPLGWRHVKLEWQDGHWWFSKHASKHDWWRLRYW